MPASCRTTTIDPDELDRILGTFYATVEQCFLAAVRIGFASRFFARTGWPAHQ